MNSIEIHDRLVRNLESLGQGFSADFNLKLERIEHLLDLLDNPQKAYRVVHVGGTSGKGTVSTLVETILRKSGFRTGLITSPYLQVITETCQINGKLTEAVFLSGLLDEIMPLIRKVETEGHFGLPSYSEVLLALGLLAFKRRNVEVAVVEAFLGGRLDATNIIDSDVAVLVSVGLDHIEILGASIEEIAADKIHIIKPGKPAICGFVQESARELAREFADSVDADLYSIGKDFSYRFDDQRKLSIRTPERTYEKIAVRHDVMFQGHNAACAVMACEKIVGRDRLDGLEHVIEESLQALSMPGRFEKLDEEPVVIIDGAHNPPKIQACLEVVKPLVADRKTILIYSAKKTSSGKLRIHEMLEERQRQIYELLAGIKADTVIFTEFRSKGIWHADSAEKFAREFRLHSPDCRIKVITKVREAFATARELAGQEGAIFAVGSFHLAGEIRDLYVSKEQLLDEL